MGGLGPGFTMIPLIGAHFWTLSFWPVIHLKKQLCFASHGGRDKKEKQRLFPRGQLGVKGSCMGVQVKATVATITRKSGEG